MLSLSSTVGARWDADPVTVRIRLSSSQHDGLPDHEALLVEPQGPAPASGYRVYISKDRDRARALSGKICGSPTLTLPPEMDYLGAGDIVRLVPRRGAISVLFRAKSVTNAILLTERCNCNCLMCPQPPRHGPDHVWENMWPDVVRLMPPSLQALGITGGEPTVAADALLRTLTVCREHLPDTSLQVLTNGRMCNYMSLCRQLAALNHPRVFYGIPLYSDLSHVHDYLVQARGAYDQTIRGVMNLKRCGQSIEIRTVILKQNARRLPKFARFVARNLPFVDHVALMGMELMGHAKAREKDLWIAPSEYQTELADAVGELSCRGLQVSIFNHPLCVLDEELWQYAAKSISDWKAEFAPSCSACGARELCGGVFASCYTNLSSIFRPCG